MVDCNKFTRKAVILQIFSICLLINACQPDFEINSGYKEAMIVYCLLNSQDSVHYIRITRSVLNARGESLDSLMQYPVRSGFLEPLDVWVEKWGIEGQADYPIPFQAEHSMGMGDEYNAYSVNSVYSSTRKIDPGSSYRLFVTDPVNGKTLTAICYAIDINNLHYQIDNKYSSVTVDCLDSVYFYQTELYFSFVEVSSQDTIFRRIPVFKHTIANETKKSGSTKVLSLDRPDIMELIGKSVKPKPGVRRFALKGPYEFRLVLGDEILFDYQNTLFSTAQKYQSSQPITNIRGGKGIFSSIYRKSLGSIYMQDYWYVSLSQNQYTRNLNFQSVPWNE